MKIEIDKLNESELIDLNNRIIQRVRFLQQTRAHTTMLEFSLGERVSFQPEGRSPLFGVVTRYNKKTVTVITDGGEHWNVAPSALSKTSTEVTPVESGNILCPCVRNDRGVKPGSAISAILNPVVDRFPDAFKKKSGSGGIGEGKISGAAVLLE